MTAAMQPPRPLAPVEILDHLDERILRFGRDDLVVSYANLSAAAHHDLDVEALVGRSLEELLQPTTVRRLRRHLATLTTDVPSGVQVVRENGRWTVWEDRLVPIPTGDEVVSVGRDVTAQREHAAAAALATQRFDLFLGQSLVPTAVIGLDGRFLRVNDALCRFLGRSRDELLTLTTFDVTHPAQREGDRKVGERIVQGLGGIDAVVTRYRHADGSERWGLATLSVVRDADGQPREVLGQVVDVTGAAGPGTSSSPTIVEETTGGTGGPGVADTVRVGLVAEPPDRADDAGAAVPTAPSDPGPVPVGPTSAASDRPDGERAGADPGPTDRDLLLRMREAELLKDRFIAAMSHEIRTPLTVVQGIAELLQARWSDLDPRAVVDLLARLERNTARLDQLLADLLDLNRLQHGEPGELRRQLTDLAQLVHRVIEGSGHPSSRLECDLATLVVEVEPRRCERIVDNLVGNALRHAPVDVPVRITLRRDGDGVRLTVADAGPGIPDEDKERVFDAFSQVRAGVPASAGAGIGLTVVRRFAVQHGGRTWVEDRAGGGAEFHVWLPEHGP